MNKDNKKLVKNSALLLLGNFASKILVFLLVPFYTAVLSTEEYGTADLITTTVNLLYPVLTVMISTAVLRFCLDEPENAAGILLSGLVVEGGGFLILLPATSLLAYFNLALRPYMLFLALYYLVYALNVLLLQYAKGLNNVSDYALAGVINTIGMVISNLVLLLFLHAGVKGYLCALIIGMMCSGTVLIIRCHVVKALLKCKFDSNITKQMLRYAFPMVANNLSWWINNSSDRYIMAAFRTVSELGVYSVSYKVPSLISVITTIFINAWEISAVDDFGTEKSQRFFTKIYNLYAFVNVCFTATVMLFVRVVAKIIFQKDFYTAWMFALFLLIGHVFQTQGAFLGTVFTAAKKSSTIMKTTLMGAAINTGLNFLLIPQWGAQGAAIATMVGYFSVWIVRLYASRAILKIEFQLKRDVSAYVILLIIAVLILANKTIATVSAAVLVAILFALYRKEFEMVAKGVIKGVASIKLR